MDDCRFQQFAARNPTATALIDSTGTRWSRGALASTANQISHALLAEGLRAGDVIAILAPNCAEFVATYMAATDVGLYVLPINWHLSAPEIAYVLENSGACTLFAHERLDRLVQKLLREPAMTRLRTRISFGTLPGFVPLSEWRQRQSDGRVASPTAGRMLIYTSATTGRPKAIDVPIADADSALSRSIAFHVSCGISREGGHVHLCASMLYHAAPLDFVAIALHMGHSVVLVDCWEPMLLLQLIHEHRVTTSFMVPSMFIRLLKLPREVRSRYDLSSLRLVSHSAAPCPREVKKELMQWWGPVLWEGYGAAEGSGTAVGPEEWLRHPGTVGRPIPGSKLRILDEDGQDLPAGKAGTIYFTRFTGDRFTYRNDPEKTAAAYRGDYFTVGDVGFLDSEGYLYICDRKIDMIICGGLNVYSAEVEQILVQHPAVLDCAVFGIPDPLMGEAVCAAVQPAPGVSADAATTEALVSFLRERLSVAKIPRKLEYVDSLPRDPNGKLFKRLLREKYLQEHAGRV
jgi:long-chain acyl-CoA synthetase